jgi:crotonobetainyl-CoA:carnitine CoA-transferase CaiB-like acyl-CoA transferase
VTVDDPAFGHVTMPGVPITLTASPGKVRRSSPALGERVGSAPYVRGRQERPAADPPARPGPLSGFRILDMGTFVAGPFTGCLLAELGADVIKVEPVTGDRFRQSGFTYNRGMRSLAVDLKASSGVAALHALVAESDAVVMSVRPGTAPSLGLDYATLARVNPRILTLSLSAYGEQGPLAGQPGVDMVLQAMSGMMSGQGGSADPVCNTLASIDCGSAAIGSLAVALLLLHRERHGVGQHAWHSLAGAATFLQFTELIRSPGRAASPVGGQDFKGHHPLDRYYETSDGWVRVQLAAGNELTADQASSLGIDEISMGDSEALYARLAERTSALSTDEAVELFQSCGVSAVKARRVSEAQRDEGLLESEFVHLRPATGGGVMYAPGRYARFSRTQRRGPMIVEGVGESTRAILLDAGLATSEIDRLLAEKVVAQEPPAPQTLGYIYR